MSEVTRVHHLNCAHLTRMQLGGKPLACHVVLLEPPRTVWSWWTAVWAQLTTPTSRAGWVGRSPTGTPSQSSTRR